MLIMGDFRFEFQAVGGHGCDRLAKEGETLVHACRKFGCPDCEIRAFVERMTALGMRPKFARLTHWPDQPTAVVDDLAPPVPVEDQASPYWSSRVPYPKRLENDFYNSSPKKTG
ncbi:MAG: hypothetical protein NVS3B10_05790 [Polyangiales bacterium]